MIEAVPPLFYLLLASAFGHVGILWREAAERAIVQRILLPQERQGP